MSMVFFCHVERTGGATVHSHFAKFFGGLEPVRSGVFIPGRPFFVVSGPHHLRDAWEVANQLPDRRFYLGGHVGLHHLRAERIEIADSDVVFTIVRDPVERAASLYFLVQRSPEWFGYAMVEAAYWGFEYFYSFTRDNGIFHNDHCRLIADSDSFEETVACIERFFSLVGTNSQIAMFEKGLEQVCGPIVPDFRISADWKNAAWHDQTDSGERIPRVPIHNLAPARLYDRIVRENEEDVLLVDFIQRTHGGLFVGPQRAAS